MSKNIQAIRGMNDILPSQTPAWQHVESVFRQITRCYGYQEIRLPIVEKTELFKRAVGEVTDIVEKEMYTFEDRNGDSLSLRPEGTASCVRAGIEHGLFYNQIQRLWYMGPQFRHERPQKGRYRQFHQLGIEAVGMAEPSIDAEIILLSARIFQQLNITDHVVLQINSLGSHASRAAYRDTLVNYFTKHKDQLDDDSLRRLEANPLRILDSKNPTLKDVINDAPKLTESLDDTSKYHFDKVCSLLTAAGIDYEINPQLVRGLDYYCHTVFEWITDSLGAQGTVCAGGRYDTLIEQLGGKPSPAIGFALGIERLVAMLTDLNRLPPLNSAPDAYLIMAGNGAEIAGLALSEKLRTAIPEIKLINNCSGGSFKNQFKKADKSGAQFALIIGDDEVANGTVTVKYLREDTPQTTIDQSNIAELFA